MENEIINICRELKKLSHCKCCGGDVISGICNCCGNINERSGELIDKLKELLKNDKQPFPVLAELINIHDLEIPFVNSLISSRIETMKTFLAYKLEQNEYADIINLLSKDNASLVVDPNYFFKIAEKYFCGEIPNMDDETYLKFVQIYTKNILEKSNFKSLYDRVPKVEFVSAEEIKKAQEDSNTNLSFVAHGLCIVTRYGERILLNSESFLSTREISPFQNIITIYHELQHLVQKNYSRTPSRYNVVGLMSAKDKVLEKIFPNYYDENYELVAFENDAEYNAYMAMANDLVALRLNPLDFPTKATMHANLLSNRTRFINGKEDTLDNLFDQYVSDPNILIEYPILTLEYKIEGGKIVRKTPEETASIINQDATPELKAIYQYISNRPLVEAQMTR